MRHFQSLNGWSYAFGPYFNEQLTPLLTGDRADLLAQEIDPYSQYRYLNNKLIG